MFPHPCPELLWDLSPWCLSCCPRSRVLPLASREHPTEHPVGACSVAVAPAWFGAGLPSQSPSWGILPFPPAQARCTPGSHPPAKAQGKLVPSCQDLVADGHPCAGFGRVSSCASLLCRGVWGFAGVPCPGGCASAPLSRAALPSASLPSRG